MKHLSAVDQLEDAVVLLASQSARAWLTYLAGVVPWLLAVLYFAEDMLTGYRADRCLVESLLLALLFIWASVAKARFAGLLLASIGGEHPTPARSAFSQCLFLQLVFQSSKLIVFPLAIVSVVPLGWVSSFFRNVTIEANRPDATLKTVAHRASSHASSDPGRYWIALLILLLAALVLLFNLFAAAALLPELAKTFTGFENAWTRNAHNIVNLNLLAIVLAAAWFLLDPLFQAFSVVRYFYSEARADGRDLLLQLSRLAVAGVCLLVLFLPAVSGRPSNPPRTLTNADLVQGVRVALHNPEFAWHSAAAAQPRAKGRIADLLQGLLQNARRIRAGFSAAADWLRKLLFRQPQSAPQASAWKRAPAHLSVLLVLLAALLILAVTFALLRVRRASLRPVAEIAPAAEAPDPLRDDNILPSDLPEEEWLRLARQYLAAGEGRAAIRALYLSNLAYLGARHLVALRKSKTNGSYERELRLRASDPELSRAFAAANRDYEKAWYGLHQATLELTDASERYTRTIRQHV